MSTITSIHEHAVEVDTRLASTHKQLSDINYSIDRAESAIRRATGQNYIRGQWDGTLEDALAVNAFRNQWDAKGHADGIKSRNDLLPTRDSLRDVIDACNKYWRANGCWSRFYLVTNTNGHIHSSLSCSTCFHDTNFAWLTHLSGLGEADAVQAEGEVLCTICYPSAPVAWTNGISRRDKEAKAKREAEKAERQRIKAEKSLSLDGDVVSIRTDPKDGSRYYGHKDFKTLRSAELWLVEASAYVLVESWKATGTTTYWASAPDAYSEENVSYVVDLYTLKTGKTIDEVIAQVTLKALKRLKQ